MHHMPTLNLKAIRDSFDALSPEEKEVKYAENRKRIDDMVASWEKFSEAFPELAKTMTCASGFRREPFREERVQ